MFHMCIHISGPDWPCVTSSELPSTYSAQGVSSRSANTLVLVLTGPYMGQHPLRRSAPALGIEWNGQQKKHIGRAIGAWTSFAFSAATRRQWPHFVGARRLTQEVALLLLGGLVSLFGVAARGAMI